MLLPYLSSLYGTWGAGCTALQNHSSHQVALQIFMSLSNKVKSFFQAVMKPSPSAVSQAFKALKPHVPLIKFRKGSGSSHHGGAGPSSPAVAATAAATRFPSAPSKPLKQNEAYQLPTIEDWQLQGRFQRRPLDEEEIAFINRGGPDKL